MTRECGATLCAHLMSTDRVPAGATQVFTQVLARPDIIDLAASNQALCTWSIFIGRWLAAAAAAASISGTEVSPAWHAVVQPQLCAVPKNGAIDQ